MSSLLTEQLENWSYFNIRVKTSVRDISYGLVGGAGFEPAKPYRASVLQTDGFSHSPIPPCCRGQPLPLLPSRSPFLCPLPLSPSVAPFPSPLPSLPSNSPFQRSLPPLPPLPSNKKGLPVGVQRPRKPVEPRLGGKMTLDTTQVRRSPLLKGDFLHFYPLPPFHLPYLPINRDFIKQANRITVIRTELSSRPFLRFPSFPFFNHDILPSLPSIISYYILKVK